MKKYAPILLRIGISLIFLWFGLNQIFDSSTWVIWLPEFARNMPIEPVTIILFNGIIESILGIALIIGYRVRFVAFALGIHLLGISFSLGYNDVAIRDFGLAIATFSVMLHGPDDWCKKFKNK